MSVIGYKPDKRKCNQWKKNFFFSFSKINKAMLRTINVLQIMITFPTIWRSWLIRIPLKACFRYRIISLIFCLDLPLPTLRGWPNGHNAHFDNLEIMLLCVVCKGSSGFCSVESWDPLNHITGKSNMLNDLFLISEQVWYFPVYRVDNLINVICSQSECFLIEKCNNSLV